MDGNITSSTLAFVLSSLTEKHHKWLETLQPYLILYDELILCHGTPDSDTEYMLEEVSDNRVRLRRPEDLEKIWKLSEQQVLLCGHSHVSHGVSLASGRLIMNPGSVGLPAYTDDWPFFHAMETGSPHARYTILQGSGKN
jgi:diadenosine tetraphosphatase ApaH/serine/threonine PP2A family protein phosphatase